MGHLSPEEQLRRAGKSKADFTKEVMDYTIMLLSDQMGIPLEYKEIPKDDQTA